MAMTNAGNRRSGRREQRVQAPPVGEHGGAAKPRSSSAHVRSAATEKAAQTRAVRRVRPVTKGHHLSGIQVSVRWLISVSVGSLVSW